MLKRKKITARGVGTTFVAVLGIVALAACTTPSTSPSPSGTGGTGGGDDVPELNAESFTPDFSAMEELKGLAS